MEPLEIFDLVYRVNIRGGGDEWRPCGYAPAHPLASGCVFTTPPIAFDPENDIMTTASGRVYKIMSYGDKREKVIGDILADIERSTNCTLRIQ